MTLIYAGIASLANALWAVLLLPVALLVIQRGVIEREERYLEGKFGEEYLSYKKTSEALDLSDRLYSPECVEGRFSEVVPASSFCYRGCNRSGGERGRKERTVWTTCPFVGGDGGQSFKGFAPSGRRAAIQGNARRHDN
jgi:hypothetical protein